MIWEGVPLGFDGPDRSARPISYNASSDGSGNAPTLIYGPPGSSKTVGHVICQLLDDDSGKRSYLVIDPKGEACAVTSKFRRRVSDVKIINAYGLLTDIRPDMESDGWNPLADLESAALSFEDDCQAKGLALIKTNPNEHQPHFPDSARSAITGTIAFEVREADARKQTRSLPAVRRLLTLDAAHQRAEIEKMIATGDEFISSRVAKFLGGDSNEIQSIKSTIDTQTGWMTKPMREDMTRAGGINLRGLASRPMTVYAIVPTEELQAKGVYLRLLLSSALRALYRHDGVPTTLLVEEGFVLGYHAEIEQALSILRAFGSRISIIFQSYSQITHLYPQTHGLFTAGAILSFRPADMDTAKWLVERAGKEYVAALSSADPASPHDLDARPSWQQQQRDRIPLDAMFGMPRGRALVWLPHSETPRMSWVKGYFEIPELARRASENPYHRR